MGIDIIGQFYKFENGKYTFIVKERYKESYDTIENIYKFVKSSNYFNKSVLLKYDHDNTYFMHIYSFTQKYPLLQFQQYIIKATLYEYDRHLNFEFLATPILYVDPKINRNVLF